MFYSYTVIGVISPKDLKIFFLFFKPTILGLRHSTGCVKVAWLVLLMNGCLEQAADKSMSSLTVQSFACLLLVF